MKIGSLLPIFVVAAFLGGEAVVYGDTGNLRGPLNQSTEQTKSVQQVTIIEPSHNNLRNGTLESNEMTKRKRRRNHDTKDAGEKGQSYLLRGTIANAAANELPATTNNDETTAKEDKQNIHEEHKQKLAVLDDEISRIRQRIKESQEQLRAKMHPQTIVAEDKQETLTAENEKEEDLVDLESDSDSDCGYYSFHQQSDGNSFRHSLPAPATTPHSHETCRLTSNIIHKSEIHARALIGDGECHFDSIHGHWYQASCVLDDNYDGDGDGDDVYDDNNFRGNRKTNRRRLPRFVFTKAFCSSGCESCADPEDLPGVHGRPDDDNGSMFRNFGRPAVAVCELPPPTKGVKGNKKKTKEEEMGGSIGRSIVRPIRRKLHSRNLQRFIICFDPDEDRAALNDFPRWQQHAQE